MKEHLVGFVTFALAAGSVAAAPSTSNDANLLLISTTTNTSWWAGIIDHGWQLPLAEGYRAHLCGDTYGNQGQPLLLRARPRNAPARAGPAAGAGSGEEQGRQLAVQPGLSG